MTMMKIMKMKSALLKSAFVAICVTQIGIVHAEQRKWKSFVTPIQCKTLEAQLTSVCYSTRKDDEPAICKSQTLEFQRPAKRKMVLFKAVRPRTKGEYLAIGWHGHSWFCSPTEKRGAEILTIDIADWFNSRHEHVIMFDRMGKRLTRNAVNKIANTPAWRNASGSPEQDATAHGSVVMPTFE